MMDAIPGRRNAVPAVQPQLDSAGPHPAIAALLERLKHDPRRRGLTVILENEQPDREFAEWTMACVASDDLPVEDRAALSRFFDEECVSAEPGLAMRLLRGFKETMAGLRIRGSGLGGGAPSC